MAALARLRREVEKLEQNRNRLCIAPLPLELDGASVEVIRDYARSQGYRIDTATKVIYVQTGIPKGVHHGSTGNP